MFTDLEPSRLDQLRKEAKERLRQQGFYATHRWLRNQGYSLTEALLALGYPLRFSTDLWI